MSRTSLKKYWSRPLSLTTLASLSFSFGVGFGTQNANAAEVKKPNAKESGQLLSGNSSVVKGLEGELKNDSNVTVINGANGNGNTDADAPVPAGLVQLPASSQYYSPYAFVVDKQARILSVWQQTGNGLQEVAHYAADLGKNSGDKKGRGDAKTPEGIYFLTDRLEGSRLDSNIYGKRAFTTDYPNFFDIAEGKTGSGIWLHAVPDTVALTRGSKGCVVVRNDSILDLTQYITLKRTPILIQNSVERLNARELGKITSDLGQWLEAWRAAWERKDIPAYIANYGEDFKSMKMNREKWKQFKTSLNEQYKQITVKISRPAIFADRNRVVVRFLQEYTSDQHADFGEKVLFLKKSGEKYRIVGEQWSEETSQVARDEIEATTKRDSVSPSRTQIRGQASGRGLGASSGTAPTRDLTSARK